MKVSCNISIRDVANMKKIFYITFFFVLMLFLFCTPVFCVQSEIEICITRIEKQYETMDDYQAHFEQETHLVSLKQVEKATGKVYFKKGGKMLWEYKKPTVQKFVLDGKNLWLYLPEDKQVMKNNFSAIPKHVVFDLFRGKINIQQKFKVSFIQNVIKDKKTEIVLELIPLVYDPTITKLTLWVDPDNYHVTKSFLENEFGNKTVLKFSEIKVNTGIDDSFFEFTPPPGVEIFEPPQL